jgi:hypothetical protein
MFAPLNYTQGSTSTDNWLTACGIEDIDPALPVNDIAGGGNARYIPMPLTTLGSAAEAVPCAITVQVMNPASLMNANGINAMGRVNQQLHVGGDSRTWNQLGDDFVSYFSPRLLTGGKLVLEGVTASSYPLDMSEFASFKPLTSVGATRIPWTSDVQPAAMAPIVFYQKTAVPVNLNYLITMEWRVRFDPSHPAAASHKMQGVTSDKQYQEHIANAAANGHGVHDTPELLKKLETKRPDTGGAY